MNTTLCITLSDADRHRLYAIASVRIVNADEALRCLIREETARVTDTGDTTTTRGAPHDHR
jgi:hypothetical protein